MNHRLVIAVGMPRAGSGWHYNLVHDLVVANGGSDAREIRKRFRMQRILTEINCNIGVLSLPRMLWALVPVFFGNTYAIKAHAGPRSFVRKLIERGIVSVTYIYRDPRDALLSAYEYGQRMLRKGGKNAFSHLDSIEAAIAFMQPYVEISKAWLATPGVHALRYEDFISSYEDEVNRLTRFLDVPMVNETQRVIEKYRPEAGSADRKGMHFVKGKTGRYREVFTPEQIALCQQQFGEYIQSMGYED